MRNYDLQPLPKENLQVQYQGDENKLQMPWWRIDQEKKALQKSLKPIQRGIPVE